MILQNIIRSQLITLLSLDSIFFLRLQRLYKKNGFTKQHRGSQKFFLQALFVLRKQRDKILQHGNEQHFRIHSVFRSSIFNNVHDTLNTLQKAHGSFNKTMPGNIQKNKIFTNA